MNLIKLVCCMSIIVITLSMGLLPSQVEALAVGEVEALWTTPVDPNPWSDHTRCDAVFAEGRNWLYFDWAQESVENPDIFLWDGATDVPVVYTGEPEFGPRVLYHEEQFYLTYRKRPVINGPPEGAADAIYRRMSPDGITFGDEILMYEPPSNDWIGAHDIIFANGLFYLAYTDFASGDILVVKSPDLIDWSTPEAAADTQDTQDYAPDLCWARGMVWLAWDYTSPDDGISTVWITSSRDGVVWNEPTEIPPTEPYNEVWGPFSLIWSKGRFILATRARHADSDSRGPWRIVYSTSRNGYTWTDYVPVTSPSCDPPYYECVEKGSVVYPILDPGNSHGLGFAIVFKRLQWYNDGSDGRLFFGGIYRVVVNLR